LGKRLSPARRRAAVEEVRRTLPKVSERQACRVLGQPRAERKDHVWAYDFVLARTHEGLPLRLLVVVDEWTRECLSLDVARQLSSDDVLERLSWLMAIFGGLSDVIEADWIENEATLEAEMDRYMHLRQRARDVFELKYAGTINPDANR